MRIAAIKQNSSVLTVTSSLVYVGVVLAFVQISVVVVSYYLQTW